MGYKDELNNFESAESLLEEIEKDLIVSENYKPILLEKLKELFLFKEFAARSVVAEKWIEIDKILNCLESVPRKYRKPSD